VLIQRVAAIVAVHVADPEQPGAGAPARVGYYCRFGERMVRAHAVLPVKAVTAEEAATIEPDGLPLPSSTQVLLCRCPLVVDPQVVQVEALSPWASTYSVGSERSLFTNVNRPNFASISPPVAPFLPQGSEAHLTVSGTGFSDVFEYTCNFTRPASLNESWVTPASRIDDEALSCPLPAASAALLTKIYDRGPFFFDITVRADWPAVALGETRGSESTSELGRGRVLAYNPPRISTLWPDHGSTAGGTPVYLRGENFSLGLAQQMLCRFAGDKIVPARVISASKMLLCETPAHETAEAAAVSVEVSVDGLEFYGAQTGSPVFTYTPPPAFDPAIESISPQRIGADMPQSLTIVGAGFPSGGLLAPDYPLCRFNFEQPSIWKLTHGTVVDSSTVACPSPPGPPDASVVLELSFNGHEFYTVLSSAPLELIERPAVMATDPAFGYPGTPHELSLDGQRLEPVDRVGFGEGPSGLFSAGLELPITPGAASEDVVQAPGAAYANVSTLGERLLFGSPSVPVEVSQGYPTGFSDDRVVFHYVDRPRLLEASPGIVSPSLAAPILALGRGLLRTPAVRCKFGAYWATSARVINETAIECVPPVDQLEPGQTVPLAVTFNGYDLSATVDSGDAPLELYVVGLPVPSAVLPTTVFVGEQDFVVDIVAEGLYDSEWISCRVAGIVLKGTFHEDPATGTQYVRCVVPSTWLLSKAVGAPFALSAVVSVEASNDGQLFSASGLELALAGPGQLQGITPSNGPARGGTVIDIALASLPAVNDLPPELDCLFPGEVLVPVTFVTSTLVKCIAPPLAVEDESVWEAATWAWAPVDLLLGERPLGTFLFAYTRGVAV